MSEGICLAGLDVHARKTAAAAVQLGSGEVFKAQIPGPPLEAIGWLQSLPGSIRAVYEAGPTGFALARAAGVEVMVCSPGAIPRQPGDRIKTDTRDALKLARLHAAGQLRPVLVPTLELEALRDLVGAREDLRGDLMAARHRIGKLLLRRGLIFPGPGDPWASQRHLAWLTSIRLDDPLARVVLGEYLACHEALLARRDRLDALIAEQAQTEPWVAAVVGRLRCMRGIDTLTAVGLVAEIGDFSAFAHPRQLASFVGLVPSERSSGDKRRQGTITKAGSSHARRLLIEATVMVSYCGSNGRTSRYLCSRTHRQQGTAHPCQAVGGLRLDRTVSDAFLDAVTPAGVDATADVLLSTGRARGAPSWVRGPVPPDRSPAGVRP